MVSHFLKGLKTKGYRQQDIAEKIGVSREFISNLSRGANCSLETAVKLADAFGVPLDTVIGRQPPAPELTETQRLLIEMTEGDDEIARAALRCAEGEKLIKQAKGERGRVKRAAND